MYEKWKSRAFPYKIRTKCEHIFFTPREGGRMEETMQNEYELKKLMCDIGKRIYDRNMVAANDGNISVKLNDNEFLCTPTGVSKGFMTPDFICKVDAQGKIVRAHV